MAVDSATMLALFAITIVGLIVMFLVTTTYNDVISLRIRIDKAWANIDVVLRQRFDQLPALVDAVRGQMAFERDVLEEVTARRADYRPAAGIPSQAVVSEATTVAVQRLLGVVESYPVLKSNENVLALQGEISRLEQLLAARRELYNDQVLRYNTRIAQVPTSFMAGLLDWEPRPFFKAGPDVAAVPDTSLAPGA